MTDSSEARRLKRISFDNSVPWSTIALFVGSVILGLVVLFGYFAYKPVPYVRRGCVQLSGWSGLGLAPHRSVWWCERDFRMLGDEIRCDAVEGGGFVCALPFRKGLAGRVAYGDDLWVTAARSVGYCPAYSEGFEGVQVPCEVVGRSRVVSLSGYFITVGALVLGVRGLWRLGAATVRGVARRGQRTVTPKA